MAVLKQKNDKLQSVIAKIQGRLNCNIEIAEDLSKLKNEKQRVALLTGRTSTWFDKESDTVYVYRPNIGSHYDSVNTSVLFRVLQYKDIEDVMLPVAYRNFQTRVIQSFDHENYVGEWDTPEYLEMMKNKETRDLRYSSIMKDLLRNSASLSYWEKVAESFCELSGFPYDRNTAGAMKKSVRLYIDHQTARDIESNNYESLSKRAGEFMENKISEEYLELGNLSESYTRIGYPAARLNCHSSWLADCLDKYNLPVNEETVSKLIRSIQNPVAILGGRTHVTNKGVQTRYLAVTDIKLPDYGYLTVLLPSPHDVKKAINEGKKSIRMKNMFSQSNYELISNITRQKPDGSCNVLYLRPAGGRLDSRTYDMARILDAMERMTPVEMFGRKNDSGNSLVQPMNVSRRLIDATNIVENFKNPISNQKYFEVFGEKREHEVLDSLVKMRLEFKRLNESERAAAASERKKQIDKGAWPFVKRMNCRVEEGPFTKAAISKMHAHNVLTVADLISLGEHEVTRLFGPRAHREAVRFLDELRLSFSSVRHYSVIRIDNMESLSTEERADIKYRDFGNIISRMNNSIEQMAFALPRDAEGHYFEGADLITLVARMHRVGRWHDCNIFLTEEQLKDYCMKPTPDAIPVYIDSADKGCTIVYNMADTDFASKRSDMFARLVNLSLDESCGTPGYVTNILSGIAGYKDDIKGLRDYLDQSCRRQFSAEDFGLAPRTLRELLEEKVRNSVRAGSQVHR